MGAFAIIPSCFFPSYLLTAASFLVDLSIILSFFIELFGLRVVLTAVARSSLRFSESWVITDGARLLSFVKLRFSDERRSLLSLKDVCFLNRSGLLIEDAGSSDFCKVGLRLDRMLYGVTGERSCGDFAFESLEFYASVLSQSQVRLSMTFEGRRGDL